MFFGGLSLGSSSFGGLQAPALSLTSRYSRGGYSTLPTNDNGLENDFAFYEYGYVSAVDGNYSEQTTTNEYSLFVFREKHTNSIDEIAVSWTGKSSLATTTEKVYLEIYNYATATWDTLDINNTVAANIDFTLSGSVTDGQQDYYGTGDWFTCRIRQLVATITATLSTDLWGYTVTPTVSTSPSISPSISPSLSPSISPSPSVSISPSVSPSVSVSPSISPSISPSVSPSISPSVSPSVSLSPSISPSVSPSISPSISPSLSPSISPSVSPSVSLSPSISPSLSPSISPSVSPSISPSIEIEDWVPTGVGGAIKKYGDVGVDLTPNGGVTNEDWTKGGGSLGMGL